MYYQRLQTSQQAATAAAVGATVSGQDSVFVEPASLKYHIWDR